MIRANTLTENSRLRSSRAREEKQEGRERRVRAGGRAPIFIGEVGSRRAAFENGEEEKGEKKKKGNN